MKLKHFLIPLLFFVVISARAERIDGPANFRDKPNGQILVSLREGVEVECGELENGWFEVSFSVLITNEQYSDRYIPKKGTPLFDQNHRLIGITLADIPKKLASSFATSGTEGHFKSCWIEITGYVYKANIKENSIAENILDSTFKPGMFSFNYDSLKLFMKQEGYDPQGIIRRTLPHCEEYSIYESGGNYRIGLIFDDKELIAIEHSRIVSIGVYKEYATIDGNKLIIFRSPKGMTIKTFVHKINASRMGAG